MPRPPSQADVADGSAVEEEGELASPIATKLDRRSDRPRDLSRDPSGDPAGDRATRDREASGDRLEIDRSDRRDLRDLQGPQGPRGPEVKGETTGDDEEIWFDPDELARASTIELGSGSLEAATLVPAPPLDTLRRRLDLGGISLARLPGWPGAGPAGQGVGEALGGAIGRLTPGDLVLLCGAGRGVGRTSLLAQLGDGLALRGGPNDEEQVDTHTPVSLLVEEAPEIWRARSLARYSGLDVRAFVGARSDLRERAGEILERFEAGAWAQLEERQRFARPQLLVTAAGRRRLVAELRRWRARISGIPAAPARTWPVVLVDPIPASLAELPRVLASLAELARAEGWIVIASADADEGDHDWSRRVDRSVVARAGLSLASADAPELDVELLHRHLGPKLRVATRWDRASGRFWF